MRVFRGQPRRTRAVSAHSSVQAARMCRMAPTLKRLEQEQLCVVIAGHELMERMAFVRGLPSPCHRERFQAELPRCWACAHARLGS